MGWFDSIKKYVWDENFTPYRTPAEKLTRFQADREIFAYAFFLAILLGVLALAALAKNRGGGALVPDFLIFYAGTISASAVVMGAGKHLWAAKFCVPAPIVAYAIIVSRASALGFLDHLLLGSLAGLGLWYALRVVAIIRAYPDMPEGPANPDPPEAPPSL